MESKNKKPQKLLPPGLSYIADNITSRHNLLGAARMTKARWAKDLRFSKETGTIFFAGCGYQYGGEMESMMALIRKIDRSEIAGVNMELAMNMANFQKKIGIDATGILRRVMGRGSDDGAQPLRDAVKVLNRLGIEFGYLGEDEPCCGGPLYYFGLRGRFEQHARGVYAGLKEKGVRQVISIIPSCTNTLRNMMPEATGKHDIEVKHFTQVVVERLGSLDLRFPREVKVAYHDPCQLTRFMGLADEPRQILRAIKGVELVEPAWTKGEFATCCGGGAGFEAVFPELSEILAVNRARELAETGAEIIVTQCPGCVMQLKAGVKGLGGRDIEVLDLAEVLAMAMDSTSRTMMEK
ncbi:MAG: (Fe-S)-binding protein [Chloroflexi bacterium]|nr:(Fe-S)-binding protein [Chloroflexota bacterium]